MNQLKKCKCRSLKSDFCRFAWGVFCKNDFKEPKNFQEVGSRYPDPKWEGAGDMFWFFVVSKKQGFTQNACMFLGISLLSRGLHQKNGSGVIALWCQMRSHMRENQNIAAAASCAIYTLED